MLKLFGFVIDCNSIITINNFLLVKKVEKFDTKLVPSWSRMIDTLAVILKTKMKLSSIELGFEERNLKTLHCLSIKLCTYLN